MNIYKISQSINLSPSAYRVAVVIASTPEEATFVHPGGLFFNTHWEEPGGVLWWVGDHHTGRPEVDRSGFWVKPRHVTVQLVGPAEGKFTRSAIVCARTAEIYERVETFAEHRASEVLQTAEAPQP